MSKTKREMYDYIMSVVNDEEVVQFLEKEIGSKIRKEELRKKEMGVFDDEVMSVIKEGEWLTAKMVKEAYGKDVTVQKVSCSLRRLVKMGRLNEGEQVKGQSKTYMKGEVKESDN